MMLIKFAGVGLIVFLNLIWIQGILFDANSLTENSNVHDKAAILLHSCFAERLNTIIASPDLVDIFYSPPLSSQLISVLVLRSDFATKNNRGHFPGPANFVLSADSGNSVAKSLQLLKSSIWWSIDGFLLVINAQPNHGCKAATEILEAAWNMNLLSSFYICADDYGSVTLFTFNPYSNRAPQPWKGVRKADSSSNRWTLFKQSLKDWQINCKTLNFDKTKFMKRNTVTINTFSFDKRDMQQPGKIHKVESMEETSALVNYKVAKNFLSGLNVVLDVHYDLSFYKITGRFTKVEYDVEGDMNGIVRNINFLYPVFQGDLRISTQHRKFLRPEDKIREFYSAGLIYLSMAALLVTVVFFVIIYKNKGFGSAVLDVLRMMLSTGILRPLNRTSIRIFLFGVFHLIIILNATFQGNISAFLTKPQRHDVDSMKDLEKYQYRVYTRKQFEDQLGKEFGEFVDGPCGKYAVNDDSAACIDFMIRQLENARNHGLHISRQSVYHPILTFHHREDWPLKNKANYNMLRLARSGLIAHWTKLQNEIPVEKLHAAEDQETQARFRPIQLDDLMFAFKLLAFGLTISTAVFIIEVIWKSSGRLCRKSNNTVRPQSNQENPIIGLDLDASLTLPQNILAKSDKVRRILVFHPDYLQTSADENIELNLEKGTRVVEFNPDVPSTSGQTIPPMSDKQRRILVFHPDYFRTAAGETIELKLDEDAQTEIIFDPDIPSTSQQNIPSEYTERRVLVLHPDCSETPSQISKPSFESNTQPEIFHDAEDSSHLPITVGENNGLKFEKDSQAEVVIDADVPSSSAHEIPPKPIKQRRILAVHPVNFDIPCQNIEPKCEDHTVVDFDPDVLTLNTEPNE